MINTIIKSKKLYNLCKYSTGAKKNVRSIKPEAPPPTAGGRYLVTMLPGVGTGPQLMEYVKDVSEAAHAPIDFEVIETETEITDEQSANIMTSSLRRNRVGIKGHLPSSADSLFLRTHLDLFICLVHFKSYPNVRCKYSNLDIFLFRQNTEGEYSMLEHEPLPGIVESLKIITRSNTQRLATWAFEFAKKCGRKRMTIIHKANIMKLTDGLFMRTVKDVAKEYPEIPVDDMIVDNFCMQAVSRPEKFDVLITPNLYGNIITNILCGLVGGPGLMSGRNYGESAAIFEVATRITSFEDKSVINPIGMLNATADLLYYLDKVNHGKLIKSAIRNTLVNEKIHTADIGGTNTASDVVESVKQYIQQNMRKFGVS